MKYSNIISGNTVFLGLFSLMYLLGFSIDNVLAEIPPRINLEAGHRVHNGHIVYPIPEIGYSNCIEIGPGQAYSEIHDVPMSEFKENTLIKIHYRLAPYQTKTLLREGGTENAHLRIQGIPDSKGLLPVISATNAILHGNFDQWTENLGVFVVSGPYGKKPAWIEFVNLHIKNAEYAGIFTRGDHISVKGCIFENNANGIFFQANNQELIQISTYNLVEGCRFVNNGKIGSYNEHNIYTQGYRTIIQFNTIEKLQNNSIGSSIKDRSAHTVVRYNYIETSSRTIDLVEPDDTDEIITQDSDWDDVYVYGNLIMNTSVPTDGAGTSMIHYGNDLSAELGKRGTLFFTNNTVVIDREDSPWRINLFDVNNTDTQINFTNNILTIKGMNYFYFFRSNNNGNTGNIHFGRSWLSGIGTDNGWELNENTGDFIMTGENNLITGFEPGFTNSDSFDFTIQENSASWMTGEDINTSLGLSVDYNSITDSVLLQRDDKLFPNLGCFGANTTKSSGKENYKVNISVYPNPANDVVYIEGDNIKSIALVNIYGQTLNSIKPGETNTNRSDINLNNHSKGLYFLRILMDKKDLTYKLLIR